MPLSDVYLRKLKARDKPKHADGGGLYLFLSSAGGMLWRMDYRFEGKRKTLSFGSYPAVSLKDARKRREEAKAQLAAGIDPSAEKKRVKVQAAIEEKEAALTFEAVARDWFSKKRAAWTEGHQRNILSRLENQLFPHIGGRQISDLEAGDYLAAVQKAEARGAIETAHRLAQLCGQVTRFARIAGIVKHDVAAGLVEALAHVQTTHYAASIHQVAFISSHSCTPSHFSDVPTKTFRRPRFPSDAEWSGFPSGSQHVTDFVPHHASYGLPSGGEVYSGIKNTRLFRQNRAYGGGNGQPQVRIDIDLADGGYGGPLEQFLRDSRGSGDGPAVGVDDGNGILRDAGRTVQDQRDTGQTLRQHVQTLKVEYRLSGELAGSVTGSNGDGQ